MASLFRMGPSKPDPFTQFNTLYKKITDYVTGTAGSTEPTQQTIAQLYNYRYDAINNSPEDDKDGKTGPFVSKLDWLKLQITDKIETNPEPEKKTQLEQILKWFTFFDKLNFTFFRHSNSCNNTEVGESAWGGLVNKDMEPSLTLIGLIDTIDFQKSIKKPDYYPRGSKQVLQVYTSALLRTLLTAIILFGTVATVATEDASLIESEASAAPPPRTPNNRVLELNVSPFLNEKQGTIFKRGNYPESPNQMMINVGSFLDTLSKLNTVTSLDIIPGLDRSFSNSGLKVFFNELSDTIVVKLPPNKNDSNSSNQIWCFVYTRDTNNKYTCSFVGPYADYLSAKPTQDINKPTIPDNISKKDKAIDGAQPGDIYKFINWVKDGGNFYNLDLNPNITVVTHSETMNKFWREHRSNTATVFDFKAQNCSSFKIARPFGEKMGILPINGITLSSVHDDINVLQDFEQANKSLSLCGKYKLERLQQARTETGVLLSTSTSTSTNTKKRSESFDKSIAAKIGGKYRKTKRNIKSKKHKNTTRKYKKYGKTRKYHKK
jgi:hypothetical protein